MKFLTPNYFHSSVLVTSPLSRSDLIDAINQSRISLIIKQLRLKSLGFRAADRKNTPNQICDCAPITKVETINFLFKFPSNLPMNTSNWSNWNNSTCGPRRFFPFSQGLIELIQQSPECAADVVSFRYIFFSSSCSCCCLSAVSFIRLIRTPGDLARRVRAAFRKRFHLVSSVIPLCNAAGAIATFSVLFRQFNKVPRRGPERVPSFALYFSFLLCITIFYDIQGCEQGTLQSFHINYTQKIIRKCMIIQN